MLSFTKGRELSHTRHLHVFTPCCHRLFCADVSHLCTYLCALASVIPCLCTKVSQLAFTWQPTMLHLWANNFWWHMCWFSTGIEWCCHAAAGFDLLLRDAMSWPSAVLGEMLHIPTVELLPIPPLAPIFETSHSVPNPVAYIPQFGAGLTVNMV